MKRKIFMDMTLNIIATAVPTLILQLLILPSIAEYVDDNAYGMLVTILALLNVIPATLGNALNNIRLLMDRKKEGKEFDYNLILMIFLIINIVIITVFMICYEGNINAINIILILFVSILWLMREYYIVTFIMKTNYVRIVICNMMLILGYGIGYIIFLFTHTWQYIYIFGYIFSLAFIFIKSNIWKEPLKKSPKFKNIFKETSILFGSVTLTRITTYADKLLIFPILGGSVVAIYYTATLFGKVISLAIVPISSVMLAHLSKSTRKNSKIFRMTLGLGLIICIIGYFVCILISYPILHFLYPRFVNDAMQYIWITTGTTIVNVLISIINPFVLKFFDMKWQMIINIIHVVFYIILSMILLHFWGLYGFCVGALIATIFKLISMLIVYNNCKERKI